MYYDLCLCSVHAHSITHTYNPVVSNRSKFKINVINGFKETGVIEETLE